MNAVMLGAPKPVPIREAEIAYEMDARGRIKSTEGLKQVSMMGIDGPLDVGALLLLGLATEFPEAEVSPGVQWRGQIALSAGEHNVTVQRNYELLPPKPAQPVRVRVKWTLPLKEALSSDMGIDFDGEQACEMIAVHDEVSGELLSADGRVELELAGTLPQPEGQAGSADPEITVDMKLQFEIRRKPEDGASAAKNTEG